MILNNRFQIDKDRNLVTDLTANSTTKVEPRVMKVLLYLAEHSGKVVSRDELVEKLWDNYGGAEDALTQAISTLRKVCGDESKTFIRTVPKKGYVLDVVTTENAVGNSVFPPATGKAKIQRLIKILVLIVAAASIALVFFWKPVSQNSPGPAEIQADPATIEREKAEQKSGIDSGMAIEKK